MKSNRRRRTDSVSKKSFHGPPRHRYLYLVFCASARRERVRCGDCECQEERSEGKRLHRGCLNQLQAVSLAGQQREWGFCCRLARTTCVEMGRRPNGIDNMCACCKEIHITDERWGCFRLVRSKEVTSHIKHASQTIQNRNLSKKSLLMDHVCQK